MSQLFSTRRKSEQAKWRRSYDKNGIILARQGEGVLLADSLAEGLVVQLLDDGTFTELVDELRLEWSTFFAVSRTYGLDYLRQTLVLPEATELVPALRSADSLTERTFSIAIDGWYGKDARRHDCAITGPLLFYEGKEEMMSSDTWALYRAVVAFAGRPIDERTDLANRLGWGQIRQLAFSAGAKFDDFLTRSVVLTPGRLEIKLRKSEHVGDDSVVEVLPTFQGAPENWIERFDAHPVVPERFDIPTKEGIVQVLIGKKVRTVLEEIKRMPGRRVAGSRAQSFILNPFATLGEDANEVISEQQFEEARTDAGLDYERFIPEIIREETGCPVKVGLLIERASASGPTSSETHWFTDSTLSSFVKKLEFAINKNFQLVAWSGYDLEIQGDATRYLEELKDALESRRKPRVLVSYAQVHDLSNYSGRIERIGTEKPYYSPFIAKKREEDGWFPENVVPMVVYTPEGETESTGVPVTTEALQELIAATEEARAKGLEYVSVPWLEKPMKVADASRIAQTFKEVNEDISGGTFKPSANPELTAKEVPKKAKTLVLRANISAVEYEEKRRSALRAVPAAPEVSQSLNPRFPLLPHQLEGLAWLQHLYRLKDEQQVRGALLADDMGLGKTLQLLAMMVWMQELNPQIEPMLVVAPLSLLENWKSESEKFFPRALSILTAYGESLASLRLPREAIDRRLREEDGLVKFLRPGWRGNARVVLTTYETLRDLEFSFANERWSLMICDEAQRIKNPVAMVTRSAKKQNVGFKIACTGTPVENTLADLWCLFDFIQPGSLGALNDFGQRYRRPIEAKTDLEKNRVEELRERISSQILRRTKKQVAKNLKAKVPHLVELPISNQQRSYYAKAIDEFSKRRDQNSRSPFKNHLGLLQYLRLICTDPKPHGLTVFRAEPIAGYKANAPKLDWLIKVLVDIRAKEEKVIVFCEFRNIQRLLQHYIGEALSFKADIINGDSVGAASHASSRQKRIDAFQKRPGFGVIILSPMVAGFGLNIQAANHVVHYTRTWNPAKEDQATDRAYRIGQEKDVHVYYPVVKADDFKTFDVKLNELLEYKRSLAEDMLNGSPDIAPGDFSLQDMVPQSDAESIDERITIDHALRMEWRMFEGLAAALWQKQGYDLVYCTPPSSDQGVDVVAIRGTEGVLVQTKTSASEGHKLGWDTIKEVTGGAAYYKRRHPGVEFSKVGVTNQFFNAQAKELADLNEVRLLEQNDLATLLGSYPISLLEVERLIFSEWTEERSA
jgi:HJR/Mrr/RecB family endonuclease/superfamily II DNA or RNA helicase